MPLNVYDQLNLKLQGKLDLRPCNNVKVVEYSKQSVKIIGKVSATCTHANTIKQCIFYVTDIIGTLKDAIVKLDIDDTITPVVQPPRKIPQVMVEPLKQEIERINNLGVIRNLT